MGVKLLMNLVNDIIDKVFSMPRYIKHKNLYSVNSISLFRTIFHIHVKLINSTKFET